MRCVWLIHAVLALAGCASEGRRSEPTRVDSAGVSIVSYLALDTTLRLTLNEPSLSVGDVEGADPYLFSGISGIARLSDGSIAVGEARAGEIRVFDRSGNFLHSMGGRGEGPGEFQFLYWFRVLQRDTILAWDGQLRRITLFTRAGEVVGTSAPMVPTNAVDWSAETIFPDRSLLIRPVKRDAARRGATMLVDTALYVRWDPAAPSETREIVRLPVRSVYVDSEGAYWLVGFMPRHAVAAGSDRLYSIEGVDFTIRAHDLSGNLMLVIRVDQEPTSIPPDALQAYKDSAIASAGNPASEPYVRVILDQLPFPDRYPALDRIRIDASGRVWVCAYASADQQWYVFDEDGEFQAAITIPAALEVVAIERDVILGQWTDELGVVSARVYDLPERLIR